MTTYKSSEREAFVYWWRHKYSAADLEGIPEHVALNAAWAAWQARAALPQQAPDARRLDWLEGELSREQAWLRSDQPVGKMPPSLFRSNMPITRAAIDAAIAKGERHE